MTKTNPTQDQADTTTAAEAAVTVVEHLNPATLLVDLNVRHATRLDADLIDSIRQHGVLVPIVAVRTPDGGVRVRHGHRRTHAAIEAGQPTVPVVVVGAEGTTTADEIDRLVGQHAENTHRTGLTHAEQAGVVEQLHLLGVSAHQIAKRTRIARADVDAGITISRSTIAATAVERHAFLDLTQAAALAEFEDDEETLGALIEAAQRGPGTFHHAVSRARDNRARAAVVAAFTADLAAAGHRVTEDATGTALVRLTDAEGQRITAETHTTCPGHAVRIETRHGYIDPTTGLPPAPAETNDADPAAADQADGAEGDGAEGDGAEDEECGDPTDDLDWDAYPVAVWVCTDPDTHGHTDRWASPSGHGYGEPRRKVADMDPAEAAEARAARRDVIESNKAWKAAEPVRRDWVRNLLTRKTPPTGGSAFTATALATDRHMLDGYRTHEVTADLLGTTPPVYGYGTGLTEMIEKGSAKRCEVIALGVVLAAYEANLAGNHWRQVNDSTARYLRFLDALGYDRSNVERRACGDDPIPEDTEPAAYAGE